MDVGVESIIKDLVKDLVKDLASSVVAKTIEVGNSQYKKALVTFEIGFGKYLKRSYERHSKVKTLLYRDRPVDLKAHYVSTDFKIGNELINGEDISSHFIKNKRNVVVGTAGSGKSVLFKRLFIDLIENKKGYIPILIELRLLISPENTSTIFDYTWKTLSDINDEFTKEQLHFAFKEGKIALFLDGLDELILIRKKSMSVKY